MVPPLVILRGEQVQEPCTQNVLAGVCITVTLKGYITKQKFHKYGAHFVRWLKTHIMLDRPHLLIEDSHKSHVYNVAFFDLMKEMNIHIMTIPPHTSHIVQALDPICPV